jgi:hypothetical protein
VAALPLRQAPFEIGHMARTSGAATRDPESAASRTVVDFWSAHARLGLRRWVRQSDRPRSHGHSDASLRHFERTFSAR